MNQQFAAPAAVEQFVAGFEDTIRALEAARDEADVAELEKQLRAESRDAYACEPPLPTLNPAAGLGRAALDGIAPALRRTTVEMRD